MDKFYLNGTFAYREDTLANWTSHNPVLEKGEPSIVRDGADGEWLKIGDGVTSWNDLPWKRGPRGEQGPKGDTGPIGPQGPQGENGKDAITDQTYSPESTNAQSGIAVAEAVKNKEDKKPWTLVKDITLSEAVSGIEELFDKKYDELIIEGVVKFESDYGTTAKTSLADINCTSQANTYTEYWGNITNGRTEYLRAHGFRTPTGYVAWNVIHDTSYYMGGTVKQSAGIHKNCNRTFNQIYFALRDTGIRFGAGTTIKVWGR